LLCFTQIVVLTVSFPAHATQQGWQVNDSCNTTGGTYWYPFGPSSTWGVDRDDNGAYPSHAYGGPAYCHLALTPDVCDTCSVINSAAYYLPTNDTDYSGNYDVRSWVGCHHQHWNNQDARWWRYSNSTASGVTENYHFDQRRNLCPRGFSVDPVAYFTGYAGYMREIDKSSESDMVSFDFTNWTPA
jgi:hypothetical protein